MENVKKLRAMFVLAMLMCGSVQAYVFRVEVFDDISNGRCFALLHDCHADDVVFKTKAERQLWKQRLYIALRALSKNTAFAKKGDRIRLVGEFDPEMPSLKPADCQSLSFIAKKAARLKKFAVASADTFRRADADINYLCDFLFYDSELDEASDETHSLAMLTKTVFDMSNHLDFDKNRQVVEVMRSNTPELSITSKEATCLLSKWALLDNDLKLKKKALLAKCIVGAVTVDDISDFRGLLGTRCADVEMLQAMLVAPAKTFSVLYAGGAHCKAVADAFTKLDYRSVRQEGSLLLRFTAEGEYIPEDPLDPKIIQDCLCDFVSRPDTPLVVGRTTLVTPPFDDGASDTSTMKRRASAIPSSDDDDPRVFKRICPDESILGSDLE